MNAIPRVRAAYAVSAAEREFEPTHDLPILFSRYQFLSERRLWPGCGFLTLYVATDTVALAQPLLALN